jgi:hypothetical protein
MTSFLNLLLSFFFGLAASGIGLTLLESLKLMSLAPFQKIVFIIGAGLFAAVFRGFGSFEKDVILKE